MCRWFNTEFLFFCTIASEHCIPVQRKKTKQTKLSHKRRGLGFGLVVIRTQEAYFAQVSFFYLLLLRFSQWGLENQCRCVSGRRDGCKRDRCVPTAFIGLWGSAMTLVFPEGGKKFFISFVWFFVLSFFFKIWTKLLWFCLCCNFFFFFTFFVCPLHFYI